MENNENELLISMVHSIKRIFKMEIYNIRNNSYNDIESYMLKNVFNLMNIVVNVIKENNSLNTLMSELRYYDDYTYVHSVNVSIYATVFAIKLNFPFETIVDIAITGLLHDIGKKFIPVHILNKKGKLSFEEFNIIKLHPELGYNFLKQFDNLSENVLIGVKQHHERMDGLGYPMGIKDSQISLYGRIIAICDVYDALITKRPYHNAFLPSDAVEFLMAQQSFDQELINVFVHKIAAYPAGTFVKLSNGLNGIVVYNDNNYVCRPVVRVLNDNKHNNKIINLSDMDNLNMTVTEVISQNNYTCD